MSPLRLDFSSKCFLGYLLPKKELYGRNCPYIFLLDMYNIVMKPLLATTHSRKELFFFEKKVKVNYQMTWVIISHLLWIWKIRPQLIQLEYVLKPCECLYRSKPSRQYSVRETVVENWLKICISFEYIKWNSRLIVYDLLGFLWGHKSRGNLGIGIFYKPNIGRVSVPLKKPLEVNLRQLIHENSSPSFLPST